MCRLLNWRRKANDMRSHVIVLLDADAWFGVSSYVIAIRYDMIVVVVTTETKIIIMFTNISSLCKYFLHPINTIYFIKINLKKKFFRAQTNKI